MEAVGVELRQGDGVAGHHRVLAQAAGHQLPVEIGADGKADGRPHGVGGAGKVSHAGQAHEQPAGHVGGLGGERGEPGAHLAASQEVFARGRVAALGIDETDSQDDDEVDQHRQKHVKIAALHSAPQPRESCGHIAPARHPPITHRIGRKCYSTTMEREAPAVRLLDRRPRILPRRARPMRLGGGESSTARLPAPRSCARGRLCT